MTETDFRPRLAAKPALPPPRARGRMRAAAKRARIMRGRGTRLRQRGVRDHEPTRRIRCLASDRRTGANGRGEDRLHDKT